MENPSKELPAANPCQNLSLAVNWGALTATIQHLVQFSMSTSMAAAIKSVQDTLATSSGFTLVTILPPQGVVAACPGNPQTYS